MKKIYLIATIALLTFSNCKKKDASVSETTNDTVAMDTTAVEKTVSDGTATDTSATNASDLDLLDTLSTKSTVTINIYDIAGKLIHSEARGSQAALRGTRRTRGGVFSQGLRRPGQHTSQ